MRSDAARFAELFALARSAVAADRLDEALKVFDQALGLWRWRMALSDVVLEANARSAAARLDHERRAARSERVDVAPALGRHNQLVPELERAVAQSRSTSTARQSMTALYRSGRQADALARYRDGRQRVTSSASSPGPNCVSLEQAILQQDPELAPPAPRGDIADAGARPPRGGDGSVWEWRSWRSRRCDRGRRDDVSGRPSRAPRRSAEMRSPWSTRRPHVCSARSRRLASGGDRLRRRLDLGRVSRRALRGAVLAGTRRVVASIPLDGPRRARGRRAGSGRSARTRPTPLSRSTGSTRRSTPSRGFGGCRWSSRETAVDRARAGRGRRRAALRVPDADRRAQRANAEPDRPGRLADGGRAGLRQLVARLPRGEPRRPRRCDRCHHHDSGRAGAFGDTVGRRAVWVADALDGTVKSIDPATSSVDHDGRRSGAPTAIAEGDGSVGWRTPATGR